MSGILDCDRPARSPAADTASEALTAEMFYDAIEAIRRMPPRYGSYCPHIVSLKFLRTRQAQGFTETTCPNCGAWVRL